LAITIDIAITIAIIIAIAIAIKRFLKNSRRDHCSPSLCIVRHIAPPLRLHPDIKT